MPQNHRPLKGIRVLDFSWLLAGPYATRILADFGAEVIKVQSRKTATGAEQNTTAYFATWNRNKLGITIDMDSAEGRELALKLAAISDVIIENFTPRVMDNWGLTYDAFKKRKQDVIMVRMSAMGQDGPWRNLAALGPTIQALSGITYLSSFNAETPMGIGYAHADTVAGLYAAFAILAALEYRERTGQGNYIDISEFETMCTLLGPALLATATGKPPVPGGNTSLGTPAAPYGCYRCRGDDRWCVIAVYNEEQWQALCHVLGMTDRDEQNRFSTLSGRQQHAAELDTLIEARTKTVLAEDITTLLQEKGVPAGVVQNAKDIASDPHLNAREFFAQTVHSSLGTMKFDTTPIFLSETPADIWQPAPLIGEDNTYVFRDLLKLDEMQLADYIKRGIIA